MTGNDAVVAVHQDRIREAELRDRGGDLNCLDGCFQHGITIDELLVEPAEGGEIAAVIVEPVAGNMGCVAPQPGFLEGLRALCDAEGIVLIIDEVSMLRADLLDAMDFMMQTVRKKSSPFGGVQVLYIGDLLQLPPVVKQEEWQIRP